MAYATINFVQPHSGRMRSAPVGFSWTTLFFAFLPALLRGHLSMAIVQGVLSFCTFGLSGIVFPFIYNKIYIRHLLGDGYRVQSASEDLEYLSGSLRMPLPTNAPHRLPPA